VFKIVHAAFIAPGIKRFVIEAPRVARKHRPGQFVILRLHEKGERIPLTIERADPELGTVNIVVQSAGKTTHQLNSLETGDSILDLVGPWGNPPKSAGSAPSSSWVEASAPPWPTPPPLPSSKPATVSFPLSAPHHRRKRPGASAKGFLLRCLLRAPARKTATRRVAALGRRRSLPQGRRYGCQ
jgi:hypothetical protein